MHLQFLVYADAFRSVLSAFMHDMDNKRFVIFAYTVYYLYVLTVNSLRFRFKFRNGRAFTSTCSSGIPEPRAFSESE
jgi:hypothetical protein